MSKNLKKQAFNIVKQRNLCSYMNNTKWNELRNAMLSEMPFPPAFIIKTLFEDNCENEEDFKTDVNYWGDWYEGFSYDDYFYSGFVIEWIKIRPRYLKHRGLLIEPELIDESILFENILKKYNIPYEKQNDIYCIYGYR